MSDDLDMSNMDVSVGFNEVCSEDRGEEFGRGDWVLFGYDICSILHGVCCDYNAVVCFGVATIKSAIDSNEQGLADPTMCQFLPLAKHRRSSR